MKKLAIPLLTFIFATSVQCAPPSEQLNQCLADATTGKDRKDLAKWMVAAMAQHPAIAEMANVPFEKVDALNRTTGALFMRLITNDCTNEVKAVTKFQGEFAVRASFEFLGKLAMQELMTNQKVTEAMSGLNKYADETKIQQILNSK